MLVHLGLAGGCRDGVGHGAGQLALLFEPGAPSQLDLFGALRRFGQSRDARLRQIAPHRVEPESNEVPNEACDER